MRLMHHPYLKVITVSVLCSALLLSAYLVYDRAQAGFYLSSIRSTIPPELVGCDPPCSSEERAAAVAALKQPFFYLTKGCQFYVFESEDRKYVLKFFKHKHLRSLNWLERWTMFAERGWLARSIERREERIRKLITSCRLAYTHLRSETGLLAIHLTHEPLWQMQVALVDRLGFSHTIELDHHEFILQRRAYPLDEVFAKVADSTSAGAKIAALRALIERRCAQGVADRDPAFVQNVGFFSTTEMGEGASDEAGFFDCGQFYLESAIATPEIAARDVQMRIDCLHLFCKQRAS